MPRFNFSSRHAVVLTVLATATLVGGVLLRPTRSTLDLTDQPTLGRENAPARVVVFEDFKCPSCRQFDADVSPLITSRLVDTGLASYTFVNFPFLGPDSQTAALAAECVQRQNEDAFWTFKDRVFRAQEPESEQWATTSRLLDIARDVDGVDPGALQACLESDQARARVNQDLELVRAAGVNSTPTVFVNGTRVAHTFEAIEAAVRAAQ